MADYDEQQVRTRLEQRVAEIESTREKMRKESEGGSELADYDQHPGDMGSEMHDQELDQTTELLLDDERGRIDEALSALDAGTYGTCVVCGKEIPAGRVEAMPEAVRCIDHQRELEAHGRIANQPPLDR
ncbi:MAG: TraR/DksA C4-type zinc finger protein [Thermoleophilaceae bacterium]|jgi:DnaK suppressor protein